MILAHIGKPVEFSAVVIILFILLLDIHLMIVHGNKEESRLLVIFCMITTFLLALIAFVG